MSDLMQIGEEQIVYLPMVGPLTPIKTAMRLDQSWGMFSRLTSMDGPRCKAGTDT